MASGADKSAMAPPPDSARPAPILAASSWPTNAELIADVARLGWLTEDGITLDPTYGKGNWWTRWRPRTLITHDLAIDAVDFRALPEPDCSFDQITYDPPYIAPGGRAKSTIPDFNERYGLHSTPRRPDDLQAYINEGLAEMARVLRPGGTVVVKCCDYINGGSFWAGTHHTLTFAIERGLVLVDRLEHVGHPGPQPERERQVHARRNLSTLLVLKRPGRRRPGMESML